MLNTQIKSKLYHFTCLLITTCCKNINFLLTKQLSIEYNTKFIINCIYIFIKICIFWLFIYLFIEIIAKVGSIIE